MRDVYIYLIVFIIMLLIVTLQLSLFEILTLVGTSANLGVIFIATIGLMTGEERGAALGGVYGLLMDVIEGKSMGIYLLSFLLLGYVCGRIGKSFSKENRTTATGFVGVGTVAFELICYMIGILLYKMEITPFRFVVELGKETVYNMFLAIISFRFLYFVSDLLNRTKKNYYLL